MQDSRKLDTRTTKIFTIKIKECCHKEDIMDYKTSGVDIEAGYKSVELMKNTLPRQ